MSNLDHDLIEFEGVLLTMEEIQRIEVQRLMDSMQSSFDDISFDDNENSDEEPMMLLKDVMGHDKPQKEDKSGSRSSMENFASPIVTVDDYEPGAQQFAFEEVFKHSRNCFNLKTNKIKRYDSLIWVFVPDSGQIPFDLCCESIGIRPNLMRIRIQYELFKNWIVLNGPINSYMEPLPKMFEAEIMYNRGEAHVKVAKKIWEHPSISTSAIFDFCKEHNINKPLEILEQLDDKGHISHQMDYWYFIGRNPFEMTTRRKNLFNWTSLAV